MKNLIQRQCRQLTKKNNTVYIYADEQTFYRINDETVEQISPKQYMDELFGNASEAITQHYAWPSALDVVAAFDKSGGVYTQYYQDDRIYYWDAEGEMDGYMQDNFDTIYSMAIDRETMWVSYPTNHTIKQYILPNYQEMVSVGDREAWSDAKEIFDHPEQLTVANDGFVYVADTGNKRVVRYDASADQLETYLTCQEAVLSFIKTSEAEYVQLPSGVYKV